MMKRYAFVLLSAFVLVALSSALVVAAEGYSCTFSGAAEVPPNASPGTGTGVFILNDAATELSYNIQYSGLMGTESASHFHTITVGPCPTGTGGVTFGVPTGTPKVGVWAIPAASVTNLRNGCIYFNIHSNLFPGGEIRGNIVRDDAVQVNTATWGRVKVIYR